jgi:para-aminobenzoate synthetase/4-amino-4-deoxychorismate lyase
MAVEDAVAAGLSAAGFITYEAAPGLDTALRVRESEGIPLVWFGLYDRAEPLDALAPPDGSFSTGDWEPSIARPDYERAIARIKQYIAAGDTYQVNYTLRLRAGFRGDPYAFFRALCRAQRGICSAFVQTDDWAFCSASPELFFALDGDSVISRPMKGTARRGLTWEADEANATQLRDSEKNRAENIMIVDMIRNDLGRVADAGSVRVESLFDVERYPTLLQMTSTVSARTPASVGAIIGALFPCASVTGAPKVRTMEIIRELESAPRGIYTGAIGYVLPGRRARFSVAIRTVAVDVRRGRAEYGVGGGIVWDSDTAGEYEECRTKARILTAERPEFELLETLLWTPAEGYFLLDRHLRRMERSAAYFGYALDLAKVRDRLTESANGFREPQRVRLRVNEEGAVRLETGRLSEAERRRGFRVRLAGRPVDTTNPFLYHKTTCRAAYEAARAGCPDCDDVILFNERNEVTETTIANIAIRVAGRWTTPPVACGLLNGTFRDFLVEEGELVERVTTVSEITAAREIRLINSVRKWIPAEWAERPR